MMTLGREVYNLLTETLIKHTYVRRASNEISSFLNCPKIDFKVEKGKKSKKGEGITKISSGRGTDYYLIDSSVTSSAVFHSKGNENIIILYSLIGHNHLKQKTMHEAFHGYHYRNNKSIRKSGLESQTFFNIFDMDTVKINKFVPDEKKAYINGVMGMLSFRTIAYESLVRAYEKIRKGENYNLKSKLELSLTTFKKGLNLKSLKNFNFDLNFNNWNLLWKELLPLLQGRNSKAYDLSEKAYPLLLADPLKEPKISFSVKPIEDETERIIYPSGKKLVIETKYPEVPIHEARKIIRKKVKEDYWEFSKKLIEKYKEHLNKIEKAFKPHHKTFK